jgi:2-polyprenyl-3-methyl-5-hydroxy-6-metoxy-1,4-benzoquinol methylase
MNRSSDECYEHEAQILRSWHDNAEPWSHAIRTASVLSRELVTNAAILDAISCVRAEAPRETWRVLDLGCGEGWLTRALNARGTRALGVDAVAELIAKAQELGGGDFQVLDYASIAQRRWDAEPFDLAVCNFSLLGEHSVESLLSALPAYLVADGSLIIQTLHPIAACGEAPYVDGWRAGNWCGFSHQFSNPAPWYFRTIESWVSLLTRSGFEVRECREPKAPGAVVPSSIIWIGKPRGTAQT